MTAPHYINVGIMEVQYRDKTVQITVLNIANNGPTQQCTGLNIP